MSRKWIIKIELGEYEAAVLLQKGVGRWELKVD